jgi:hypothetical protein
MEKGMVVVTKEASVRYIGKMNTPLEVIEVPIKRTFLQQLSEGFLAFCDYAASTKAGSGEMDIGLEPQSTKPKKEKSRR